MDELPVVLGGPIVRRVEPRLATVWMALKDAAPVTLSIWKGLRLAGTQPGTIDSGEAPLASATTPTRQFGKNLHIVTAVLELESPALPLQPGAIYSYDLSFGGNSLRTAGLLVNETGPRLPGVDPVAPRHLALGYLDNRLPSFVTPPPLLHELRLAHASCRKPHGPDHDALAWLDDEIEENLGSPDKRVQQLFLTGDQIYADDVASCLLPMLNKLAVDLLGNRENLHIDENTTVEASLTNFPAMYRQRLTRELAGLSSCDAHSHLLSFGEYAAMYLAAFSPRVWRALAEVVAVAKPPTGAHPKVKPHLSKWEECVASQKRQLTDLLTRDLHFESEKRNVQAFRDTVPKVARALANVPTYMIFDDHEVTDDWNLNARWRTEVYKKELGKNVVRNGVMAYTLFQAWGNDPKIFTKADESSEKPNHNRHLLDETAKLFAGNGPYPASGVSTDRIDELCGTTSNHTKQPKFHYTVPGPRHQVSVLDTRTRRSYRGKGILPPNLVGTSLNDQVPGKLPDGIELCIVVSPAPVLGPWLIETVAQPVLQFIGDIRSGVARIKSADPCEPTVIRSGAEKYDAEAWSGDENAFEALLKRLSGMPFTVILSGDVHYGCTMALDYWKKKPATGPEPKPVRIAQLTSSASHNEFHAKVEAVLRSSAHLQEYQLEPRPERLGWDGPAQIKLPSEEFVGPGRKSRMKRTPALLPARYWPPNTTIDKPPDWTWRLSLIRDLRPDAVLPPALRRPALSADVNTSDPLPGYRAVAVRHMQAAMDHFDHLRQVVFNNNIGLVAIGLDAAGIPTVEHTLLSKEAPDSTQPGPNTVHAVTLAPTNEPQPELVTRG